MNVHTFSTIALILAIHFGVISQGLRCIYTVINGSVSFSVNSYRMKAQNERRQLQGVSYADLFLCGAESLCLCTSSMIYKVTC